jgi:hypothetical protein
MLGPPAFVIAQPVVGKFLGRDHLHRRALHPAEAIPPVFPAETFEGVHEAGHFYAGDRAGAREWVARRGDIGGINDMALETCFGDIAEEEALQSAELLATEVMPHFA